jgi:hypothetical protein
VLGKRKEMRSSEEAGAVLACVAFMRLVLVVSALLLLFPVSAALADTAPLAAGGSLPWSDPAHNSPLEQLAGQIATHIAGRPVTVRCEGDNDWAILTGQQGVDPSAELGYVDTTWFGPTYQQHQIATFSELSPTVCSALQQFASAPSKPTKCSVPVTQTTTVVQSRPVRVQQRYSVRVRIKGNLVTRIRTRMVVVMRQVAKMVQTTTPGPPQPCYANGQQAVEGSPDFWTAYTGYAEAILTLAHESIHLGGGGCGVLADGTLVGDQEAEAKAECYGMQWIPYVATQLGDTSDDAQAIAEYDYERLYPTIESSDHPEYWSADCVPNGRLDVRPDKTAPWP